MSQGNVEPAAPFQEPTAVASRVRVVACRTRYRQDHLWEVSS
jgi:hypothetical protein